MDPYDCAVNRAEKPTALRLRHETGSVPTAQSGVREEKKKVRWAVIAHLTFATTRLCAPEGIRTPNLLIRSQMLYPLSYGRSVTASGLGPGLPTGRVYMVPGGGPQTE